MSLYRAKSANELEKVAGMGSGGGSVVIDPELEYIGSASHSSSDPIIAISAENKQKYRQLMICSGSYTPATHRYAIDAFVIIPTIALDQEIASINLSDYAGSAYMVQLSADRIRFVQLTVAELKGSNFYLFGIN